MKRGLFVFAFTALTLSTDGAAQTLGEAISQLRSGAYESAIEALGEISRSEAGPDLSPGDRRTAYVAYLSALAEVGRYDDALEAISQAPSAFATELANTAGEIYLRVRTDRPGPRPVQSGGPGWRGRSKFRPPEPRRYRVDLRRPGRRVRGVRRLHRPLQRVDAPFFDGPHRRWNSGSVPGHSPA